MNRFVPHFEAADEAMDQGLIRCLTAFAKHSSVDGATLRAEVVLNEHELVEIGVRIISFLELPLLEPSRRLVFVAQENNSSIRKPEPFVPLLWILASQGGRVGHCLFYEILKALADHLLPLLCRVNSQHISLGKAAAGFGLDGLNNLLYGSNNFAV